MVDHRILLGAALLLLATGCKHPMLKAMESGDALASCRAFWADEDRVRIDASVTGVLDAWVREHVDVRLRVERVPMESLRQGFEGADLVELKQGEHELRVTVTAASLPAGSRVEVSAPVVREYSSGWSLRPWQAADGPVSKHLELALKDPVELKLEPIPAEFLPRQYVKDEFAADGRPGKVAYRDDVDPAKLAMGLVTGGILWLLDGVTSKQPEWVPETDPAALAAHAKAQARKKTAFEKEQARKKEEFEASQKALASEQRAQIEAITVRNRERVAAHDRMLAARQAFVAQSAKAFEVGCPLTQGGALVLGPGQSCSYLVQGESKTLLTDAHGVQTDARVILSADERPCLWEMRDLEEPLRSPDGPAGPYLNTVLEHYAKGEHRLKLGVAIPRY